MITLADIPMLLEDPGGKIARFMATYQPLADLRQFAGAPAALRSQAERRGMGCAPGPGIAPLTYPGDLPPRINTLYWPTGATRWARGLFLCRQSDLAALMSAAANGAVTLSMGDENQQLITTQVYLLPPRQVTANDNEYDLYLVPVVDERYWWQFIDVGAIAVTSSTTWASLLAGLAARLYSVTGSAVVFQSGDAPNAAYLQPDPAEFNRPFANVALVLDAIAASLARRLVRRLDGGVSIDSPAAATTAIDANLASGEWSQPAGGTFAAAPNVPANVLVTFRNAPAGANCGDTFYTSQFSTASTTTTPSGTTSTTPAPVAVIYGTRRVVRSAALATYNLGGPNPDNQCRLDALATQFTADWSAWYNQVYDETYGGLFPWQPNGFDNYVEWTFGRDMSQEIQRDEDETGSRFVALTRIQSLPGDVFSETQLSQDPCSLTTTSTSTTTTTAIPPIYGCSGQCKWTWSAAGNYWYIAANSCGVATTTTPAPTTTTYSSFSTTTSTSTTTINPCPLCPTTTSTTTTSGGTTTSTTSTTTTTVAPCPCSYPTFCGTTDGQCTYTSCFPGVPVTAVNCTTSTTAAGTTTTCDCSSTTTAAPCGTCEFAGVPSGGGFGWAQVGATCIPPCECAAPSTPPSACEQTATVSCATTTTGPPIGGLPCNTTCTWIWVVSANAWWTYDSCDPTNSSGHFGTLNQGCTCSPPTFAGTSGCAGVITYCYASNTIGGGMGGNPLTTTTIGPCPASCYTTTSTSTTSTTPPCGTGCLYAWSGSAWNRVSSSCQSGCDCSAPGYSGTDGTCEVSQTPCSPTTTTPPPTTTSSTTTSTSTSTTTSTSTSTTAVPCGNCVYECQGPDDFGDYLWNFNNACSVDFSAYSGCPCPPPPGGNFCDESQIGQIQLVGCGPTTTTSTTTTTTTPAPTDACCYSTDGGLTFTCADGVTLDTCNGYAPYAGWYAATLCATLAAGADGTPDNPCQTTTTSGP